MSDRTTTFQFGAFVHATLLGLCLSLSTSATADVPKRVEAFASTPPVDGFDVASFLNVHVHPEGIDRLVQLDPGLVRLFVNDPRSKRQQANVRAALDRLARPGRRFLLQFALPKRPDREVFLNDVRRVVEAYADEVDYWQLGNELDNTNERFFPFGRGDVKAFTALFAGFARTVRSADPGARLSFSISTRVYEQRRRTRFLEHIVTSLAGRSAGLVDVVDVHWHRGYLEAEALPDHLARLRRDLKPLGDVELVMTENNTHVLDAAVRSRTGRVLVDHGYQSEAMQASYGIRTVYLAFASGVRHACFGYPVERPRFGASAKATDHPFAMNGLWFGADKDYADGVRRAGPKKGAFAYWLMSRLGARAVNESATLVRSDDDGVHEVRMRTAHGAYRVVWLAPDGFADDRVVKVVLDDMDDADDVLGLSGIVDVTPDWPPEGIDVFPSVEVQAIDGDRAEIELRAGEPVFLLEADVAERIR